MKSVTLLRHFRVKDACEKKLFSSKEIDIWVDMYDKYPLESHDVHFKKPDKVYTSGLSRAKRTADFLGLEYESLDVFNEVSVKAFMQTSWRFPKFLWLLMGRVLWMGGLIDKSESKKETLQRAKEATDIMINSPQEHIMIVSHGFFMIMLVRELRDRGFEGEMDSHPQNAKPYTFVKLKA